jgi:hypothetical protein
VYCRTDARTACAAAYDVQNFKAFVYVRNKTKVGSIPASLHALTKAVASVYKLLTVMGEHTGSLKPIGLNVSHRLIKRIAINQRKQAGCRAHLIRAETIRNVFLS